MIFQETNKLKQFYKENTNSSSKNQYQCKPNSTDSAGVPTTCDVVSYAFFLGIFVLSYWLIWKDESVAHQPVLFMEEKNCLFHYVNELIRQYNMVHALPQ